MRSRRAILHESARLATVEGLEGLSIARLADADRDEQERPLRAFRLERGASARDDRRGDRRCSPARSIEPATECRRAGLDRLAPARATATCSTSSADVFPGGCFFASALAEADMRPGPVRDRLVAVLERLARAARDGRSRSAGRGVDRSGGGSRSSSRSRSRPLCSSPIRSSSSPAHGSPSSGPAERSSAGSRQSLRPRNPSG